MFVQISYVTRYTIGVNLNVMQTLYISVEIFN